MQRSAAMDSRMRTAYGMYHWVKYTGHGKSHGETFLGWSLIFFLGGRGRGRGSARASTAESFSQDDARFQTAPFFYVIYYILHSGGFHCSMLQAIAKSALDLDALGRHVAMFGLRQPVDLFHTLKTVKGLLYLVPPRTPRSSGYGVLCTCDLCYMLFLLCLV